MKRTYPERPVVAVGVVVIKDDRILLVKRSKPPKSAEWSIPGGAQELGETAVDAAIREVYEETAITIGKPHFLEVVDYIDRDDDGSVRHHYTLIDYAANYHSGALSAGDDAEDAKWVPLARLSEYNLWAETEKIIHNAVRKMKKTPHAP